MNIVEEFKARGLLAQCTDEAAVTALLEKEKVSFYIGFDPTADSLHVGHMMQMIIMARMQRAGHRPIAIFGGGTGMIGDPSGKSDMRRMMTRETIAHNIECFMRQMSHFIDISDGKAVFVNNADWLCELNYIDFLREVGVHFSVNRMLTAECYKSRMENGLTFLEFNYMLMQSYDFYELFQKYDAIANSIYDACTPSLVPVMEIEEVDGKKIIVANILPGMDKPYYLRADGMMDGTYIRIAGVTRKAEPYLIKELQLEGTNKSYDATQVAGEEVTPDEINALCERMYQHALDLCKNDE